MDAASDIDWRLKIHPLLRAANIRQVAYVPDAGHTKLIEAYRSGDRVAIAEQVQRQFDDGAARLVARLADAGVFDDEPGP